MDIKKLVTSVINDNEDEIKDAIKHSLGIELQAGRDMLTNSSQSLKVASGMADMIASCRSMFLSELCAKPASRAMSFMPIVRITLMLSIVAHSELASLSRSVLGSSNAMTVADVFFICSFVISG